MITFNGQDSSIYDQYFSNFVAVKIQLDGIEYPTVEHAYQAYKTLDRVERLLIARIDGPGQAKRAGRYLKLRADWEEFKYDHIERCLDYSQ